MAALMLIAGMYTLFAPNPPIGEIRPRSVEEAIIVPVKGFFQRTAPIEILCFILVFKLGDTMATFLNTVFFKSLGFSKTEIGTIGKGVGLTALLLGGLVGGIALTKWNLKRGLLVFGFFQGASILFYWQLALHGKSFLFLSAAVISEQFFIGLGSAALVSLIMHLCERRYAAAHYALFTSFLQLTSIAAGYVAGPLVEQLGWATFFLICTAISFPPLVFLWFRFDKWEIDESPLTEPLPPEPPAGET